MKEFKINNVIYTMQDDAHITHQQQIYYFKDMKHRIEEYHSGVKEGTLTYYECEFGTFATLETKDFSDRYGYEFIPLKMECVDEVVYPGTITSNCSGYSVINYQQGLIIPDGYKYDVNTLPFNGQFNSIAAYMPWFGYVSNHTGYICISETSDDMAYSINHSANNKTTTLNMKTLPSLNHMVHTKVFYVFSDECDYTKLCKIYKEYVKETGLYKTLKEKEIRLPQIKDLIGSSLVHKGIHKHVVEESRFYNKENIEENDSVVSFKYIQELIQKFHELGSGKIYLHLDGISEYGYDNHHPDFLPACKQAGGYQGLKELSEALISYGDMMGIHDQYRDYYYDAASFNERDAITTKNNEVFNMCAWAGGKQSYLCASLAKDYVRRNYHTLFAQGIKLQGTYLDVFTCNEMDECFNELHRMSRKECKEYRKACFEYVSSIGLMPSSEEMNDYAMHSIVFCHYAPYTFMLRDESMDDLGIPVPLFNLVYHECVIIPWFMDETSKEDDMLFALINGGIPYLDKDGAYKNVDGAFDTAFITDMNHKIERCKVVCDLHQKIAYDELVKHELLDEFGRIQRSTFSSGIKVEVDLDKRTYKILE